MALRLSGQPRSRASADAKDLDLHDFRSWAGVWFFRGRAHAQLFSKWRFDLWFSWGL